jgi:hypothetical protein
MLLCLVLLVGCGAPSDPSLEVQRVLETYFEANSAEDWARVYGMLSEDSRSQESYEVFEQRLRGPGQMFARAISERTHREIGEVRVEGDEAEVDVAVKAPSLAGALTLQGGLDLAKVRAAPLTEQQVRFSLVREEGVWKVRRKMVRPDEHPMLEEGVRRHFEEPQAGVKAAPEAVGANEE